MTLICYHDGYFVRRNMAVTLQLTASNQLETGSVGASYEYVPWSPEARHWAFLWGIGVLSWPDNNGTLITKQ